MVSGLGANSGMGSLCVTPCFVLTLQIPSKGFKPRSFLFLAYILCSWSLNRELYTLGLFCCWECCPGTAELPCCNVSVVLCWQNWLVLLQWPLATSLCAWIKQPSQSKPIAGLHSPSVTEENPALFLTSAKAFLSQLPLLSYKAVFSRSTSLGSRKTPCKSGNGFKPLHCGPFLLRPYYCR